MERGVSAFNADLSNGEFLHIGNQFQVQHVDDALLEPGVAYLLTAVNCSIGTAYETGRLFDDLYIAHNDGAAAVIDLGVSQSLDGDLRAVSGRITHSNTDNRLCVHSRTPLN